VCLWGSPATKHPTVFLWTTDLNSVFTAQTQVGDSTPPHFNLGFMFRANRPPSLAGAATALSKQKRSAYAETNSSGRRREQKHWLQGVGEAPELRRPEPVPLAPGAAFERPRGRRSSSQDRDSPCCRGRGAAEWAMDLETERYQRVQQFLRLDPSKLPLNDFSLHPPKTRVT